MSRRSVPLVVLPGHFAVCRLPPGAEWPAWAAGPLVSLTRTPDELSVVCRAETVPAGTRVEGPWRALRVAGTLEFELTGILAGISGVLAAAGVSCFALSTFDTDYLLVQAADLTRATEALAHAGHDITEGAARTPG